MSRKQPEFRRAGAAIALLLAGLTAGCAGGSDHVASVLAAPGKYEFFPCPQLIDEWKRASVRERELKALMDKSGREAGGAFVNAIAYQSDYITVRGELRMLETEAQRKKCDLPQWRSDRTW